MYKHQLTIYDFALKKTWVQLVHMVKFEVQMIYIFQNKNLSFFNWETNTIFMQTEK